MRGERRDWSGALAIVGALLGAIGCAMAGDDAAEIAPPVPSDAEVPGVNTGTGGSSGTGGPGAAPEVEIEGSFEAPIVTGKYLWSANPQSGRVALVDAETLRVTTVESGLGPRTLAPVPTADPEQASTLVLNEVGNDATLLRLERGQFSDPVHFPTHADANALTVSASGRWVVAWSDWRRVSTRLDPTDSFQDLTLMLLRPEDGEPRAFRRVAGYRPASVTFDADEQRALVVSEHGISVIELSDEADPRVSRLIEVVAGGLADRRARDVLVTPDGALALVREEGSSSLGFVDLASGELTAVTLAGPITDLDLEAGGSRAVAVMRDVGAVSVLELPGAVTDPSQITHMTLPGSYGSISLDPAAAVGVLYTNSTPSSQVATLRLGDAADSLPIFAEDLRAPVRGVFVAPDAEHALALLDPPAGSVKAGAFGVLPTAAQRGAKIVGTDAPAHAVAMGPAPTRVAMVTVRDDARRRFGVHVVALPTLQVDYLELTSPPVAAGIIAELGKGYVAQEHPEGRITFLEFPTDLASGTAAVPRARTLTGFELAAKVTYPTGN